MERENQRVAITKRLLKQALLSLLETKDIQKITITELCQAAGINRATFYRHYSVPQDVLLEMEQDIIMQAKKNAPLPETPREVKPYLENLFRYLYRGAPTLRVLIQANTEADIIRLLYDVNQSILRVCWGAYGGTALDAPKLHLLSAYLGGGGYHMLRAWLLEDIPIAPEEIAQLFFDAISRDLDAYAKGR